MTTLISRKNAKENGLTRYFTGKPCPKGHVAERMVTNTDCVDCMAVRCSARYKKNSNYRKKTIERMRRNYQADPDKFRQRSRINYLENPETFRAGNANRRARIVGSHGELSGTDIRSVLDKQRFQCADCGTRLTKRTFEVDHRIPFWKRGPNTPDNIQCMCKKCHKTKSIKDYKEWRASV